MYEEQTFEIILNRMLDRVPDGVDKREGSIIYDALAPAAVEMAQMYIELDVNANLKFADTASGEYLDRAVAWSGISRKAVTKARWVGRFRDNEGKPVEVPLESRFPREIGCMLLWSASRQGNMCWNVKSRERKVMSIRGTAAH